MIRNIIQTMITQGSVAFINLAILLLSTRYLGSEVVGKVSMMIVTMAIIQSVNDIFTGPSTIFHLQGTSIRRVYLQGLAWTVLCTGGLSQLFSATGLIAQELQFPVSILAVLSILHYFHVVLLLGREKIKLYNVLNLMQPASMAMLLALQIFVLERRGFAVSLSSLYISWIFTLCVSTFCVLMLIKNDLHDKPPRFFDVLRTGVVNEMGNLAHMLSNRYNYFILGSVSLVGLYASSTSLIEKVWIIGGSISPIILTRIANRRQETGNAFITLMLAGLSFTLSALCVVVVYFLPVSFFTGLLGSEFAGVRSLMLYLAPGVLCISFSTVISHYFSGLGQQKVLLLANVAGLAVTLALSYPLIHKFGLYGAAMTASASYAMQSLVLVFLFWKTTNVDLSAQLRTRLSKG
jgi:O-antigen/teichoic acid export membrane protein